MPSWLAFTACSFLAAFAHSGFQSTHYRNVRLANSVWTITVDPSTLETTANIPGRNLPTKLSDSVPTPSRVTNFQASTDSARWELADLSMSVAVRLTGDSVDIQFTARTSGDLTWPLLPAQSANLAYLLPIGEGSYVPTRDAAWRDYLAKHDPFSTTEDFYLPLWGVLQQGHTITYQLTNPFNNQFAFQNTPVGLAAKLTHQFTSNWNVKRYGLRISLGPPSPIEPARQYRRWLIQNGQFVSMREKIHRTPDAAKLLGAAHVYLWGDGASPQMLDALRSNGFDRLWLGAPNWKELFGSPETIRKAKALGYLIGPYDSYDSVHSPEAKPDDTWETAQFDRKLYDEGAIQLWNGKKKTGFQGKGLYVNETAAWPYVQARVTRLMKAWDVNSWFIDCDAAGEFFDDYSPSHTANQEQEMQARLRRMTWIRDKYHLVIGSEGGVAYAASTIHFAHGALTPLFGWGDPDLKDKTSPYYLGAYYPDDEPSIFFKQAKLKPAYDRFFFDPRFRLPLYQTVFHDSVIATNHWTMPTLKFSDQVVNRSLVEALYDVPPLYHLNRREFARRLPWMKAQYAFFSPLHRRLAFQPLSSFDWLTPDHLVQRTVFGGETEIVVNFSPSSFRYQGRDVRARSALALRANTGEASVFTPSTTDSDDRPKSGS